MAPWMEPSRSKQISNYLPSLKLTASLPLKMDGWNTILSYWNGLFSGVMLVSGRVFDFTVDPCFLFEVDAVS